MMQNSGRRWTASILLCIVSVVVRTCRAQDIDINGCGQTKGCFRNPDGCNASACEFLLTWKDGGNDTVTFEMSAPVQSQTPWVAFGLSKDDQMGEDSVIGCVYNGGTGRMDVEESINSGRSNNPLQNPQLGSIVSGDREARLHGGRITCRFSRTKRVSQASNVYTIAAGLEYYILMAKGHVSGGLKKRHTKRVASTEKVDLTTEVDVGGDEGETRMILTKVHGIVMVFAWCVFANFGMLMPRYYKPTWNGKTCCGKTVWFQIHQPFMIIALFLTAAAFVIIFVAVGGYSELPSPAVAHPPLGICVMALVLINPIMAICRCKPDAKSRWVFNLFHFCVGFLAQLAAATAVFLGLWHFGLPEWCMIIMAALVAFHMLVELILIIHANARVLCKCCCCYKRKSGGHDFAMESMDGSRKVNREDSATSCTSFASDVFKTVMMFVHIIGVSAFAIILAVKIAWHDGPTRSADTISAIQ